MKLAQAAEKRLVRQEFDKLQRRNELKPLAYCMSHAQSRAKRDGRVAAQVAGRLHRALQLGYGARKSLGACC